MTKTKPEIAVIGAGLGGIIFAIELKKQLGLSCTIYERNPYVAGTWADNTYPGCACDVPAHWYSYSRESNPNWTKLYADQPEIRRYWLDIARKHNINKMVNFGHNMQSAAWDGDAQLWRMQFQVMDHDSKKVGEPFELTANVLVSAVGGFSTPSLPKIPGLENFKKPFFHSARWDHNFDMKGKKVAVIGNGCSATQFVPKITEDGQTHCYQFVRSPHWIWPRTNPEYSSVTRTLFRYVPGLQKLYRFTIFAEHDITWLAWRLVGGTWVRSLAEEISSAYMRSTAPKKYHEFLIPKYPFGCKRIIRDPGYLTALHRPNLELSWDPIDTLDEDSVITKSGKKYPVDALILGTGFQMMSSGFEWPLTGVEGIKIQDQWINQGGAQAYLGTTVANFPNFFTILGPNVATGHASVIFTTECQINYIISMIKPMRDYGVQSFMLKREAEITHNRELHRKLENTVYMGGCSSYYKTESGKVIATMPNSVTQFWWKTRRPQWDHYQQVGGSVRMNLYVKFFQVLRYILLAGGATYIARNGFGSIRDLITRLLVALYIKAYPAISSLRSTIQVNRAKLVKSA